MYCIRDGKLLPWLKQRHDVDRIKDDKPADYATRLVPESRKQDHPMIPHGVLMAH